MRATTGRPGRAAAHAAAVLSILALCLALPAGAGAQWTQPDANNNITNTNTGNVGVGTANPQANLHVSTSSAATGSRGIVNEQTSNDGNGPLLIVRKSRAGGAVLNGDNVGSLYAQAYDGASFVSGSRLRFIVDGPVATNSVPTAIQFLTGVNNTGVERMRITSAGDVGIGLAAPSFRFEVSGSASRNTMALTGDGDAVGYAGLKIQALTTTGIATNRTSSFNLHMRKDSWYSGDASGPSFVIETTSKTGGFAAPFVISPANHILLNSGVGASGLSYGNVGIGTASPAHKLDVAGNVNASGLCLGGACKTTWSEISGTPSQWTTSGANIAFSTGSVGIGVSSPGARLDVGAGAPARGGHTDLLIGTGGNNAQLELYGPAKSTAITHDETIGGLIFYTNGPTFSPSFFVSHAGSVGIGTTAPTRSLSINVAAGPAVPSVGLGVAGVEKGTLGVATVNGNWFGATAAGDTALRSASTDLWLGTYSGSRAVRFVTNDTQRMVINGAGNVGVGTNAPAHKLDVAGEVNASGLCLGGTCKSSWSEISGSGSQWTTAAGNIHFNTGNVGIGTTTPDQKLGVQGMFGLYPQAWALPGSRGMFMFHGGAGGSIYAYNYPAGTPDPITISASTLDFNTYTGGNAIQRMFIANDGNVGVGTNAPSSLLNLVGANAALTFGTAGGNDSSAFSVAVTPSGENTNSGHGRGLTVKAGDSDNAAGKVGGSLTLNPGAPVSPATAYGNVLLATAGGNVGVGTSAPAAKLDVRGNIVLEAAASPTLFTGTGAGELGRYLNLINSPGLTTASGLKAGGVLVADDYSYAHPAKNDLVVKGRVGIGTPGSSAYKLDVAGSVNSSGLCLGGDCKTAWSQVGGGTSSQWTTSGSSIHYSSGSVGIGIAAPRGMFEVAGGSLFFGDMGQAGWGNMVVRGRVLSANSNVHISPPGGMGVYIDSNYREAGGAGGPVNLNVSGDVIAGGAISAKYQDVAEWVPSTQKLAAGTVVVLDAGKLNHVVASGAAYDTKVAGVISETPGLILGVGGEGKLKVATTGRVKVKVDASKGAIQVGDLLVTSGVEGVAMKSVPVELGGVAIHRPGTIIGKALEPLEKGVGEILVLLSMQ